MPCAKYPRDFLIFRTRRLPGLGVILGAMLIALNEHVFPPTYRCGPDPYA